VPTCLQAVFGDVNSVAASTEDVRDYSLVVRHIFRQEHAERSLCMGRFYVLLRLTTPLFLGIPLSRVLIVDLWDTD
jgi:hypothetical protein